MANYYIEFSAHLPLRSEAEVSRALAIHAELRTAQDAFDDDAPLDAPQPPGADFMAEAYEHEGVRGLWLHAEEGEPYDAAEFVRRLAAEFDLRGVWWFTWANRCDQPRLDAFSGGAALVDLTNRQILSAESGDWIESMKESIQGPGGTVQTIAGPA